MMIKEDYSATMLKSLFFIILCCAISLIFVQKSHASLDSLTPLYFTVDPTSNDEIMARNQLKDVIKDAEIQVGRQIIVATAREDLNNDGVKELFVRLLDPDMFCEDDVCQVYGYAVTNEGLIKIADLKTRTIDVSDEMIKGTRKLILNAQTENKKEVIWNGDRYENL